LPPSTDAEVCGKRSAAGKKGTGVDVVAVLDAVAARGCVLCSALAATGRSIAAKSSETDAYARY
jgi:hypothetical protein